jgi:hypothetical protein
MRRLSRNWAGRRCFRPIEKACATSFSAPPDGRSEDRLLDSQADRRIDTTGADRRNHRGGQAHAHE